MKRLLLFLGFVLVFGPQPLMAAKCVIQQKHLDTVPECASCHRNDDSSINPEKEVCLECHDDEYLETARKEKKIPGSVTHGILWPLTHRMEARTSQQCSYCHDQDYCLQCHKAGRADEMGELGNNMINVHLADFTITHPISARTDPRLCQECHENSFCVDCHDRFAPEDLAISSHRRGFRDGTLDPLHETYSAVQCATCHPSGSVLPSSSGWSREHAREARKNLATCQACHPEGNICLRCHSARDGLMNNPHPKDWDKISNRLQRASDGKTCRKCH